MRDRPAESIRHVGTSVFPLTTSRNCASNFLHSVHIPKRLCWRTESYASSCRSWQPGWYHARHTSHSMPPGYHSVQVCSTPYLHPLYISFSPYFLFPYLSASSWLHLHEQHLQRPLHSCQHCFVSHLAHLSQLEWMARCHQELLVLDLNLVAFLMSLSNSLSLFKYSSNILLFNLYIYRNHRLEWYDLGKSKAKLGDTRGRIRSRWGQRAK